MDERVKPPRTGVIVGLALCAVAACAAVAPWLLGMDMMKGGYALVTVAVFLGIAGAVVANMMAQRARVLGRMLGGEGLVAHWTYGAREWARYAEEEHRTTASAKKALFVTVAMIALVVGGVFLAADPDGGGPVVFAVMLALVAACGLAAWLGVRGSRRRNERTGEAWIAADGVLLNGALHTWSVHGSRLESVELDGALLVFRYSYRARSGTEEVDVRVPVPSGREEEARRIVREFRAPHAA